MNGGVKQARDEWIALLCQHGEPGAFADLVRRCKAPGIAIPQLAADTAVDVTEVRISGRGDWTAIGLCIAGVRGWEAGLRRLCVQE